MTPIAIASEASASCMNSPILGLPPEIQRIIVIYVSLTFGPWRAKYLAELTTGLIQMPAPLGSRYQQIMSQLQSNEIDCLADLVPTAHSKGSSEVFSLGYFGTTSEWVKRWTSIHNHHNYFNSAGTTKRYPVNSTRCHRSKCRTVSSG